MYVDFSLMVYINQNVDVGGIRNSQLNGYQYNEMTHRSSQVDDFK